MTWSETRRPPFLRRRLCFKKDRTDPTDLRPENLALFSRTSWSRKDGARGEESVRLETQAELVSSRPCVDSFPNSSELPSISQKYRIHG